MRQSFLATKTRKEVSVDEVSRNAGLLIRAGYIHRSMAGVYSFLPLGLLSLNKIMGIIREEMNAIGGQEVLLGGLQNPAVWKRSGRWGGGSDAVWFRSRLNSGSEVGLAWTHEEPVTEMLRQHITSYRDLPLYVYQFQTKFRNEERAKSGILRAREFIMKDLYSFCEDEEQHREFYERCATAYLSIFTRVGVGDDTYRTFASGGVFSEFSDEFQTILSSGEDVIHADEERRVAINQEVYSDETIKTLNLDSASLRKYSAVEVGNIFTLGPRFSESLDLSYTTARGDRVPVFMGSYGIGPARLLGVIAEKYGDTDSLILPGSVAPFTVHLIALAGSDETRADAEMLYNGLTRRGISVLFDDRDVSAGNKFADADLIGIPKRMVVSEKTREAGEVEFLDRMKGEKTLSRFDADTVAAALSRAEAA